MKTQLCSNWAGSTIPVAQSMSFTGAAAQSIPIAVPAGRNGIGPNLSLTYNSYQKNGWIGVGWSLEMGAIQRATKRGVSYDPESKDFVASVNGSSSDLVHVENGEYRAKIEGAFSLYNCPNPQTDGWVVTTKDGTQYFYGTTTASRQYDPEDSTRIFKWCLDRVEDPNGNYMEIFYDTNYGDNEIYLSKIDYTGNVALPSQYSVEFLTEARTDVPTRYTPKFPVTTTQRLKTIRITGPVGFIRKYELTYDANLNTPQEDYSSLTGRSLLGSVQQFADESGTTSLPPATFTYQEGKREFADTGDSWINGGSYFDSYVDKPEKVYVMDINGDRKGDIVVGPDADGYFEWLKSTGDSFTYSGRLNTDHPVDAVYREKNRVRPMDVNGDGLMDMVLGPDNDGYFYYLKSTGDALVYQAERLNDDSLNDQTLYDYDLRNIRSMDVNGDGMMDIVAGFKPFQELNVLGYPITHNDTVVYTVLLAEEQDGTMKFIVHTDTTLFWPDGTQTYDYGVIRTRAVDVNGDGYSDIVIGPNTSGEWSVWESNGNDGFENNTEWFDGIVAWESSAKYPYRIKPIDVNGDGLTDLVCVREEGENSRFEVMINTGKKFLEPVSWLDSTLGHLGCRSWRVLPMDANGDGMVDIVVHTGGSWYVVRSTGTAFVHDGGSEPNAVNNLWEDATYTWLDGPYAHFDDDGSVMPSHVRTLDAQGDGLQDFLLGPDKGTQAGKWYLLQTGGGEPVMPDLLLTVENGMGGETEIGYTPSARIPDIDHTKLPFVIQTASEITIRDGRGNEYVTNYTFDGGDFDFKNRDFLGFATAVRTNPDNSKVETSFYQDEFRKGRAYQVEMLDINGISFSNTSSTWDSDEEVAPGSRFVKLTHNETRFTDTTTVTTTEDYEYDSDCGGITRKTVSDGNGSIVTESDWINKGNWMWRLEEERLKAENGESNLRHTKYVYNDTNGNLTEKQYWLSTGAGQWLPETFTYDAYGNPTGGLTPRGNAKPTIEYDTTTRMYPATITNSLGHSVEKLYNYTFGKVSEEKDPNGNWTYYGYDDFGRGTSVTTPDGGQVTTDYHLDETAPNYVKTTVKVDGGDEDIISYQFFDGLGRMIQTVSPSEVVDRHVVTRKEYDEMSRVKKVYGPQFYNFAAVSEDSLLDFSDLAGFPETETVYDARGRVEQLISYDTFEGQRRTNTVTYTYTGLVTKVTDPDDKSKTEVKDAFGRVVEVIEHGDNGDISTAYKYNTAGDLLKVSCGISPDNVTTNTYDTLGRKRTMVDPDMGEWSYTYDPNGNLETQTDANGQTIRFAYDELDRVTDKIYENAADLNVLYEYYGNSADDKAFNRVGMLKRVSKTDGETIVTAATAYVAYDIMGRASEVTRSINGITDRTTEYAFDLAGRPDTIIYPDGYMVEHSYYPGTTLLNSVEGITSDGTTTHNHAVLEGYTPSGKIKNIIDGSNARTTYTYDSYAERLMSIQTVLIDENELLQHKSYEYTGAGNVKSITDYVQGGIVHEYEYDNLHRLKQENLSDPGTPETFTPALIIPDYSGAGPFHAIKSATVNGGEQYPYDYDNNGNMTTGWDFTDPENVAERTIDYNADNMPTSITHAVHGTTGYEYDGEGTRVKKTVVKDGFPSYYYYVNGLFEIKAGNPVKYIFAGNLRIAMIEGSETYYFQKDHLGSTAAITKYDDGQGIGIVDGENRASYLPFGGQRGTTSVTRSDYAFTDQERDPESGLYNYNARLYDPVVGMFITPDSIVQDPFDPQTLNRYSYCRNNPLIYVDPSGHIFGVTMAALATAMAKGAAVGAVVGGAMAAVTGGDIGQGMITGAVSGAFFGGAGAITHGVEGLSVISQAGVHAAAGASSGAINAAITGGDIGKGALVGGISGSFSKFVGATYLEGVDNIVIEFAGYTLVGGVSGGIAAEIYGGDFGNGFMSGLETAAYGFLFNKASLGERVVDGAMKIAGGTWKAVSCAAHEVMNNDKLHSGTKFGFKAAGYVAYQSNKTGIIKVAKTWFLLRNAGKITTTTKVGFKVFSGRAGVAVGVALAVSPFELTSYGDKAIKWSNQIESFKGE